MTTVECRACAAGLPLVWHIQSKKAMHLGQGLSVVACKRIDAATARLVALPPKGPTDP